MAATITGDVSAEFEKELTNKIVVPLQKILKRYTDSTEKLNGLIDKTTEKLRTINFSSHESSNGGDSSSSGGKEEKSEHKKIGEKITEGASSVAQKVLAQQPFNKAASFDQQVRDIATHSNTLDKDYNNFVATEKEILNNLAHATAQASESLAKAADSLVLNGIGKDELNPLVEIVARTATAFHIDLDKTGDLVAMLHNRMGITDSDAIKASIAEIQDIARKTSTSFEDVKSSVTDLLSTDRGSELKGRNGLDEILTLVSVLKNASRHDKTVFDHSKDFAKKIMSAKEPDFWKKVVPKQYKDYSKFTEDARKRGENPFLATLKVLKEGLDKAKDPDKYLANLAGSHNVNDMAAIKKLLTSLGNNKSFQTKTSDASSKSIDKDFNKNLISETVTLNKFNEEFTKLIRHIGDAFMPVVRIATSGIHYLNGFFDYMDKIVPHFTAIFISVIGGIMVYIKYFGGKIFSLRSMFSLLSRAFSFVLKYIRPLIGIFTSLVTRFISLEGIMELVGGVIAAVGAPFEGMGAIIVATIGAVLFGLYELWKHFDEVGEFFDNLGGKIGKFIEHLIDIVPDALSKGWHNMTEWWHHSKPQYNPQSESPPIDYQERYRRNAEAEKNAYQEWQHNLAQHYPTANQMQQKQEHTIRVKIEAEKGLKATAYSSHPNISIDHGLMMGRP